MESNTGKAGKLDYKWVALGLLWVAFFLQQGTRQLFGPSVPSIMSATGADKVAVGAVGTVFAMVYAVCVPFAGITADIFRRKWMVTLGVGIFCLGIFVSGFVATVGLLTLTYGILNGAGQSFYYPSATSLVSQLHRESRATAISILQLGLYIGIIGCGTLAGFCASKGADGWRWPFWVFGGIGLAWTLVLVFCLRDTRPVVAPGRSADKPSILEALKAVFSKPSAICTIVGLAMMIYVDIGFKNWMPTYLQETFRDANPSLAKWAGLHAVLWHYVGAIVGVLLGSRIGDRLVKGRPGIRLELGVAGLALSIPFIVGMSVAGSFALCWAAMLGFGVVRGVYDSNFMASFFDVVNPRYHASGVGIMMCAAFFLGSVSSTTTPVIKNGYGWTWALGSFALVYLVGALVILLARVCFLRRDYEK